MRNTLISISIIIFSLITYAIIDFHNDESIADDFETIEVDLLFMNFDFDNLVLVSDLILLVEITDDATEDNFNLISKEEQLIDFYSLRSTNVIEVIKGSVNQDPFIIDYYGFDGSTYYKHKNYNGLIKGEIYLVFLLENDITENSYFSVSCANGLIKISDITEYGYEDIGMKSLLHFFSNYNNENASIKSISLMDLNKQDVTSYEAKETIQLFRINESMELITKETDTVISFKGKYYFVEYET